MSEIRIIQDPGVPGKGARILICDCGAEFEIQDWFEETCPGCGQLYNGAGQRLAPRDQWGEETGETLADIYNQRDPWEAVAEQAARSGNRQADVDPRATFDEPYCDVPGHEEHTHCEIHGTCIPVGTDCPDCMEMEADVEPYCDVPGHEEHAHCEIHGTCIPVGTDCPDCMEMEARSARERPEFPFGEFPDPRRFTDPDWR